MAFPALKVKGMMDIPKDSLSKKGIVIREIPGEKLNTYRKNKDFNYSEEKESASFIDNFFNWLFRSIDIGPSSSREEKVGYWVLVSIVVCIVAFGVYRVFGLDKIGLFQRKNQFGALSGLNLNEEEDLRNLDSMIKEAVQSENFREAIRFWYYKTLDLLNRKGQITLKTWKSNQNYLFELEGKPGFDTFRILTYYFDYSFYGGFQVNPLQYKEIEKIFQAFNFEK